MAPTSAAVLLPPLRPVECMIELLLVATKSCACGAIRCVFLHADRKFHQFDEAVASFRKILQLRPEAVELALNLEQFCKLLRSHSPPRGGEAAVAPLRPHLRQMKVPFLELRTDALLHEHRVPVTLHALALSTENG